MNMNTNNIIERVKMRAKRLLDDCSENNRSLCNQKVLKTHMSHYLN